MVRLILSGGGLTLRAGDGLPDPPLVPNGPNARLFSPGRVTEQLANPVLADSFFDIFFEISPTPFGPLHNNNPLDSIEGGQPCRMTAEGIDRVPPIVGTEYTGCGNAGPVDLYDAADVHRAVLTGPVSHFVGVPCGGAGEPPCKVPEPSTLVLVGAGLVGLTGISWRRHRRRWS